MKEFTTKLRRFVPRLLGGLALLVAAYLALAPSGRYLVRAAWEEGRILARRRPIPELVREGGVDPATRAKLALVLAARDFASDSVALDVGESFTTYSRLDRDTLVLLLSGSYRDRLRAKTWWFPVVGRVPYKGYFDFGAARRARADLEADGYDTYMRPVSAFSTLGFFNDPLLPTTLRQDSLGLVDTIIHELLHNTFYAAGEAVFNESFANFVGARGAGWFFRARGDDRAVALLEDRWHDERVMAGFWGRLHHVVDSTFDAHPGDSLRPVRLRLRDSLYTAAREELRTAVRPRVRTIRPQAIDRIRLDNAVLLARRTYSTELDLFDAVWEAEGRDLRRTIARVIAVTADAEEPFVALRAWVAARTPPPPPVPAPAPAPVPLSPS